jgi:hypothetical protein
MLRKIFFVVFALFTAWIIIQCDTTDPPIETHGLVLELMDVSCTEAWIELSTINLQIPTTVTLKQNNQIRETINLVNPDSILYIDSLLPNTTYSFQSFTQQINQTEVNSNKLSATTMDTTSHNFTFETFTFGEHDASFLWDVAIIDENNILAVGEIYINDSLGNPDPKLFNLIKWDNSNWNIERVYYNYQGANYLAPLQSIYGFTLNDIWVGSNQPMHWIGSIWQKWDLVGNIWDGWINKIWGSNSNDLYIVGDGGNIAYYNGSSWSKIASGTETRINDVWGIISNDNKTILYCPVSTFFVPGDKKILKVIDGRVDSVSWNRDVRLYSAWAVNENILYVCGEGVYVNRFGVWNEIDLYPVETGSVRGNGSNDIFIVGDAGSIFHFNGVSWKMLSTPNNKSYSKIAVKGNIVVICGNYQGQGLIEIGIRN